MRALLINTATRKATIAVVVDGVVRYLNDKYNADGLSVNLVPMIETALEKVGLRPSEIDTLFVASGPGSFTGIRIGLTVAKVMAWGLKIKVVSISSLELMATSKTDKKYIAPLIDARRGYVYAGLYDKELNPVIGDAYVSLEGFREEVSDKEVEFVSYDGFDFGVNAPECDVLKVIDKHKDDEGINPHELNPNYLKKTEAEEKLKERRR